MEVPTAATAEDKAVHLCLQPKSDGARVPFRTLGKLSFVIKDTQGAEYKQSGEPTAAGFLSVHSHTPWVGTNLQDVKP